MYYILFEFPKYAMNKISYLIVGLELKKQPQAVVCCLEAAKFSSKPVSLFLQLADV